MIDQNEERPKLRNNPVFVISVAIACAIVMAGISLLAYYNSDTRTTVIQIQKNQQSTSSTSTNSATIHTGPVTVEELSDLSDSAQSSVGKLDDENDLGPSVLTDSALGL